MVNGNSTPTQYHTKNLYYQYQVHTQYQAHTQNLRSTVPIQQVFVKLYNQLDNDMYHKGDEFSPVCIFSVFATMKIRENLIRKNSFFFYENSFGYIFNTFYTQPT